MLCFGASAQELVGKGDCPFPNQSAGIPDPRQRNSPPPLLGLRGTEDGIEITPIPRVLPERIVRSRTQQLLGSCWETVSQPSDWSSNYPEDSVWQDLRADKAETLPLMRGYVGPSRDHENYHFLPLNFRSIDLHLLTCAISRLCERKTVPPSTTGRHTGWVWP